MTRAASWRRPSSTRRRAPQPSKLFELAPDQAGALHERARQNALRLVEARADSADAAGTETAPAPAPDTTGREPRP